jgi:uroporphyrinogen decarboxylase
LLDDLIEAGLDAINPVQISCRGMESNGLKADFGDRLTFWGGGVETQSTLPFGTPEEVRAEVAERIRIFAPGGGFVFNPIHNIQPNTPPENIAAAYEAALEFGQYPIAAG